MTIFIRIFALVAVGYLVFRVLGRRVKFRRRGAGFYTGSGPDCRRCRNCKTLFDDGVICSFGDSETFKNEVHVANCNSFERVG